ncbi:nitrate ABC transporter ATPase [Leuconostoc palmae]|uniref:nitrate ABC transporter ATPase n=1 Tax=Leuconostoc palmae TaxID=501487 RepID=UPI001C7D1B1C|nr:nitrate ABC transporter ATPase [Leuconostoc palmae]
MKHKVENLLEQVNAIYPGTVMTRVAGKGDGRLHVDRVSQEAFGDRLLIELAEDTESDFLFANELLKMLLTLNGITPQIFFSLTFQDEKLDQQLIQIAARMHRSVIHAITYRELRKQDVLTELTGKAYLSGVMSELSPETGDIDDEILWRLLMLVDALIFADAGDFDFNELADVYPLAYTAAKELVAPILLADLKQPRHVRRQVVNLFSSIDSVMEKWGKPTINAKEYVALTSVFSNRQLNQSISQVFRIYHSEMFDFQTHKTAYVGLNKVDGQNSFIITKPENQDSATFFKDLYQMKVGDFFQKVALPYIVRGTEEGK